MSGLNKYLSKKEKVQCLCCLSTEEPEIIKEKVLCADCGTMIQAYINLDLNSLENPVSKAN